MKKIVYFAILIAGTAFLYSCNDEPDFPGLDEKSKFTNMQSLAYTLTQADYKTIASNNTNKALAAQEDEEDDLAELGDNGYFTSVITAAKYLPAFLETKWYTVDDKSRVTVTYNKQTEPEEYVSKVAEAEEYTLTNEDYESVWNDDTDYFTPTKPAKSYLSRILNNAVTDAEEGDYLLVTYNYSDREPGVSGGDEETVVSLPIFEDFETGTLYDAIDIPDWKIVSEEGSATWTFRSYNNNMFAQTTAYNMGDVKVSLITPRFEATSTTKFTFDYEHLYYTGNSITVWVGENVNSTDDNDWTEITSEFNLVNEGTNSQFLDAGTVSLAAYADKTIAIRFTYIGSNSAGTTTTMRIDNVSIYNDATRALASSGYVGTVVARNAVYQYSGTSWVEASDIVMLDDEDYTDMGGSNPNFSSSFAAEDYIPTYLTLNYPYAKDGDVKVVVYKYYSSGITSIHAQEYTYTKGEWVSNEIQQVSEQFTRTNGAWVYSPGVLVELPADRNNEFVTQFMRNVVEYVGNTYGTEYFQTGYDNAEFYYGFTFYYNNVNFNLNYWRNRNEAGPTAYGDLSDEELEELQYARLPEAFKIGLEMMYPDAAPSDTGSMIYTVYFALYTGANVTTYNYMIQFEVVAKGQFEYVEDSLGPIE